MPFKEQGKRQEYARDYAVTHSSKDRVRKHRESRDCNKPADSCNKPNESSNKPVTNPSNVTNRVTIPVTNPLSKEEHKKVIMRLRGAIKDIESKSVPVPSALPVEDIEIVYDVD